MFMLNVLLRLLSRTFLPSAFVKTTFFLLSFHVTVQPYSWAIICINSSLSPAAAVQSCTVRASSNR